MPGKLPISSKEQQIDYIGGVRLDWLDCWEYCGNVQATSKKDPQMAAGPKAGHAPSQ